MNEFDDLMIVVGNEAHKLNVLGIMQFGEAELIVLTDVPVLEILPGEYEIFYLIRENGRLSISDIETDTLYDSLCEMWEENFEKELVEDSENDS